MQKIEITIEKGKGHYGAYAENVEMITGIGDSIEEAKASIFNCIEIIKTFPTEQIPLALKSDYELIWKGEF
ncbi:hypothetical protein [Dyadobacter sp. 3J3]|uniref:hypothetical protein n=1 Tax=Dyadobacter sp. 3J3 TaxID=2606600 RepID=UPI0013598899|nr:hypothetical protein [Dyadobacter sp. 3J3]